MLPPSIFVALATTVSHLPRKVFSKVIHVCQRADNMFLICDFLDKYGILEETVGYLQKRNGNSSFVCSSLRLNTHFLAHLNDVQTNYCGDALQVPASKYLKLVGLFFG